MKQYCLPIFISVIFLTSSFSLWGSDTALTPPGYAVATAHPLATEAGLNILAEGGNAFDAAVAISAVLGVVEPYHSGLGGGGFWLLHFNKTDTNIVVDGREVAPLAAKADMFLSEEGNIVPGLSLNGALAAAIPGEPAALALISRRFGRLPLIHTLAPAIRLAKEGFIVDHQLYYFLTMGDRLQQLKKFPSSAAIFLNDGKPYLPGMKLVQRDLANTLKKLALEGHDGFYRGEVAQKLVSGVRRSRGIWSLEDLATYQVKIREPLEGSYRDMRIITVPLPSAGGISLLMMLNVLSEFSLEKVSKIEWVHYLIEVMRMVYWQRSEYMGDSDFIPVPVERLLSTENALFLRSKIKPYRATSSEQLTIGSREKVDGNTTHFSVIDGEGNRVAATLSINYIFGASLVPEGTGVLLNDQMDDFTIKPHERNVFGLAGGEKNMIGPGRRPLSSMAPTFLETSDRIAVFGTPGGSRIPTMMLIGALMFHDSLGAISMVSAMRFHHQYLPDELQFEPETFSPMVQKQLEAMGYRLKPLIQYYGDMQAITWDRVHNILTAASDPRHIGEAIVVNKQSTGGYGVTH